MKFISVEEAEAYKSFEIGGTTQSELAKSLGKVKVLSQTNCDY